MSVTSSTDRVWIFKRKQTGLVALCTEVAEVVASGLAEDWKLDLDTATFEETDDEFRVVFRYLDGAEYSLLGERIDQS